MRTSYGNLVGEPYFFASPERGWGGEGAPVLFCTGYGGLVSQSLTGETGIMMRKLGAQFPTMSIHAGGIDTFGNDTAVNSIDAALAAMRANWKHTKKVVLMGLSMGFCDLMAWAQRHPDQVAGAVGCVGLTDLTEQWTANRDLGGGVMGTATINAAYGGAYSPVTHGPTRSPMEFTASLPFPVTYFYGTADALIPTATSLQYGALPNVTEFSLGAVAHGSPAIAATHAHAQFLPAVAAYSALA